MKSIVIAGFVCAIVPLVAFLLLLGLILFVVSFLGMPKTPKKTQTHGGAKQTRNPHYCLPMTPERRGAIFPTTTFTVKGGEMWCSMGEAVVQHTHTHTHTEFASYHLQSDSHQCKVLLTTPPPPPRPQVQDPDTAEQAMTEEQLLKANTKDLINQELGPMCMVN